MGFFTYVSKNKWITYTLLSIFGFAFIISQAGGIIDYFTNSSTAQPDMGIIADKKVSIPKYQQIFASFKQQFTQQGYKKDQVDHLAHDRAWEYFLDKNMYTKAYHLLGLEVPQEEQIAILEEVRHMPYITELPEFKDERGNFDKAKWLERLSELVQAPQGKVQIKFMEENIQQNRLKEKLTYLTQATVHTTKLEAAQYQGNAKVNITYLYIPYTSSSELEDVTYQEKEAYLKAHFKEYQVKESRTIAYAILPITPSKEDTDAFKEDLQELVIRFEQAKSPENFAKNHTDNPKMAKLNWTKSTMPPLVAIQLEDLEKGKVIGPIQGGSSYTLYRMISSKKGKRYTIAKIEKQCRSSDYTNDEQFKEAQTFKQAKNLAQWQEKVKRYGVEINSTTFKKEYLQHTLGEKSTIRQIQRWLFDPKTKVNSISDPIEEDNKYIVCIMKKADPTGTAPLEEISYKIEAKMRQIKAGKQIIQKLQSLTKEKKSLKEIAEAYGGDAKVYKLQDLAFEQEDLPHTSFAPKAIGSAFALAVNERTGVIADRFGIFIIQRLPNATKTFSSSMLISDRQKQLDEKEKAAILNDLYSLYLKKANVQDNRHIFF